MTDMRCEGCGFQTGCGHAEGCKASEELTSGERDYLGVRCPKVLRIIDRLTAALAEAEADRDFFDRERIKLVDELEAAEKRIATALTWLVSANQLRLENGLERMAMRERVKLALDALR